MDITNIVLGPKYEDSKQMLTHLAQEAYNVRARLASYEPDLIKQADPMVLSEIDARIKSGSDLTFEKAFSGMLLVLAATNNPIREALFPGMATFEAVAKGVGFLQLMAVKEALHRLTPEEVAGMVAAGTLDLVYRPKLRQVAETCGMGGDRGWETKRVKTISASTLSALVLASLGITTFKHGSYGNTTRVGSTDVPINFGGVIYQHSTKAVRSLIKTARFWYSDAHSVKTLHHLSHLLMVETVNHIIGPMTVPVGRGTQLFKLMGVNDKVAPWTIAQAYAMLHQKGFLNLGGAAIVCGLDSVPLPSDYPLTPEWVSAHAFLDEVSPRATLASFAVADRFVGSCIITNKHYKAEPLDESALQIPNTIPTLMSANERALQGKDKTLARYLARNAALGLLVTRGLREERPLENLAACYQECLEAIQSGKAFQTLSNYVTASGGELLTWA